MGFCTKMLRKFILILLNIYAVFGLSQKFVDKQFAAFKTRFNKTYADYDEEVERYEIFQYNLQDVMKQKKMLKPYTVGITQFSDLTHQDFEKKKNELPESVDWREKGVISAVKNQGQCGSCWAFATTEMIESYAAISSSQMTQLSTQQVTSCTPNPVSCGGHGGCKG